MKLKDKKNINKIKFKIAVFYGIVANCYKYSIYCNLSFYAQIFYLEKF
ncbi:hypothetical protein [Fusobacterium vincentii ATCC 49256]|uniref:Uncharacterized protein n=1 Tax=Fusobacterium vincentii ATCC 49256 TaxID=209882 RepID=Q7P3C0_FUSVC|nr:hypothetical protein [Fusobacterium vincentii ATCC 49256]BET15097.1 hypothetical protein FVTDC_10320 [Fusobacterium vincentii]